MKITNDGVEYSIKTPRYHYFEYNIGQLLPRSIAFKGVFIGDSYIQDLRFIDWLGMMINNKIVMSSEDKLTEAQEAAFRSMCPIDDPFLVVESVGKEYLTQTLFTIVNTLLPEGSTLKSLKCKQ